MVSQTLAEPALGDTLGGQLQHLAGNIMRWATSAGAALPIAGVSMSALVVSTLLPSSPPASTSPFSVGSVDVAVSPARTALTALAMGPGDALTAPIEITNSGSTGFRFTLRSTTTEDTLAGQLRLSVKAGVANCTNGGFNNSGTTLYRSGHLGSTAGLSLIDRSTAVGTSRPNPASTGVVPVVPSAGTTVLCFQVAMPVNSGEAFEGRSTTARFDFIATPVET
jgi:hypothetical protein